MFYFFTLYAGILKSSYYDHVFPWEYSMFNLNGRQDKHLTLRLVENEKKNIILVKKKVGNKKS